MKGLFSVLSMAALGPIMVVASNKGSKYCLCQYGPGNAANDQTVAVCNSYEGATLHYFDGPNDRDKQYCASPDDDYCFDADDFYYSCNAKGAGGGQNCWGTCAPESK